MNLFNHVYISDYLQYPEKDSTSNPSEVNQFARTKNTMRKFVLSYKYLGHLPLCSVHRYDESPNY